MTMKRNTGLPSLDRAIHAPYNYYKEPKVPNDTEAMRTNPDNRLTKDDIASIFSGSQNAHDPTKLATSARPTVELVRANSPTLKRLLAARTKLDKYISLKLKFDLISHPHPSLDELTETISTSNRDKPTTANIRISSSAHKRIKSQKTFSSLPTDKITYENPSFHADHVRHKCSLEIWLPKADADEDDNDEEVAHRISATKTPPAPSLTLPDKIALKKSQSPESLPLKSRRSSIVKTVSTTITFNTTNLETKSIDDAAIKKPESAVIPRVYHYEDYLADLIEERPRSSKSSNTSKSDCKTLNKIIKRHRTLQHVRRMSSSTNHTDETIQSTISEKPMTSKNLLANIKQTSNGQEQKSNIGPNNTLMINELMQKYSMIKKTHQELIQAKLQLEKPRIEPKQNTQVSKDNSLGSPFTSDSASYTSSDYLTISVKRLLNENSPPRSDVINNDNNNNNNNNNNNQKLLDRRSAYRKPSNSDMLSQTRLISIVKHFHSRQASANMPTQILPAVIGKKNDDSIHSLERSKTLHVMFDIPSNNSNNESSNLPVRPDSPDNASSSSNLTQKTINVEQTRPLISKRSAPPPARLTIRREERHQKRQNTQQLVQLVQYENIQRSAQRYHRSAHTSATTNSSTNQTLVHLKYSNGGNIDRNYLLPE